MKKLLIAVLLVLCCSTAQAMTATLNDVQVQSGELVLSFTLINGTYQHPATVRLSSSELASITTWAQLWTVIQPRLNDQANKFIAMDNKADIIKSKIGVEVAL